MLYHNRVHSPIDKLLDPPTHKLSCPHYFISEAAFLHPFCLQHSLVDFSVHLYQVVHAACCSTTWLTGLLAFELHHDIQIPKLMGTFFSGSPSTWILGLMPFNAFTKLSRCIERTELLLRVFLLCLHASPLKVTFVSNVVLLGISTDTITGQLLKVQ